MKPKMTQRNCVGLHRHSFALLLTALILSFSQTTFAQETEDFENGLTMGASSFSRAGRTFTLGGDFSSNIVNVPGIGANSSSWFFDSGLGDGASTFTIGTITANAPFELVGMDLWTSNDDGNNFISASIIVTGQLEGGGTVSSTISVNPTGNSGADWDTSLDFSDFEGQTLTSVSLAFPFASPANYVAIDNFTFNVVAPCEDPNLISVSSAQSTICPGASATLSINGDLNDATAWHIYTGSCGGTSVGTTSNGSFSVTPDETTTYYVRGEGGCVSPTTCGLFTITVSDTQNPVPNVVNLPDIIAQCDIQSPVVPTATDACGGTISGTPSVSFPLNTQGSTEIIWTYDDGNGNTVTQTQTAVINDDTPPQLNLQQAVIQIDATGNAVLNVNDVDNGIADNCGLATVVLSQTDFDCTDLGANTVTVTATDIHGNTASTTVQITVVDIIPPVISEQSITAYFNASGIAPISTAALESGSDNCAISSSTVSVASVACTGAVQADQIITYLAQDASGNFSVADISVSFLDTIKPTLVTESITAELQNGNVTIGPEDVDAGSFDNCVISNMTLNINSFTCDDLGENTVVLTATDAYGNSRSAQVTVNVVDSEAPLVSANDITLELDENGSATISNEDILNLVDNGSTDQCTISNRTLSQVNFDCSHIGENTITYSLSDNSGNTASTSIIITVEDNTAPTINADLNVDLFLDANGEANLSLADIDNGSVDNCAIETQTLSQTAFTCSDIGEVSITYSVSDASGNTSTATIELNIIDNTAPTVVFAEQQTVYLDAEGNAGITVGDLIESTNDDCSETNVTLNSNSFDCTDVGIQTITAALEDNNGNIGFASTQVLVLDTIKPSFSINSISLTLNDEGTATLTEAMLLPFASDNCGILEVAIQNDEFSCAQSATTQILVFDLNGNFVQLPLTVVLEDNEAPTVTANDISLSLDANGSLLLTEENIEAVYTDNCSITDITFSQSEFNCADETAEVTVTVSDGNGNTASDTFTLTIVDDIAPTINCISALEACEGSFQAPSITASDNCSFQIEQISGPIAGEILSPGNYQLVYEAVDPSGNTGSCTIQLTVHELPVVDLGEDLAVDINTEVNLSVDAPNGSTIIWSTGDTGSDISLIITENTTVTVIVVSSEGCEASDEIFIEALEPVSVNDTERDLNINFYPNPTSGMLNISLESDVALESSTINIVDLNGRSVFQETIGSINKGSVVQLDLQSLANGVYLINIQSDGFSLIEKIIKN